MKKFLAILLAVLLVVSVAACGKTDEKPEETTPGDDVVDVDDAPDADNEDEEPLNTAELGAVGFSVSTQNNPYFVTLKEGVEAKGKELGIEIIVVDAGDDPAKQISDVEDLISKGIKVLIVNPVDSDAITPAVEDAIEAGIRVVAVDRNVNGVEIDSQIASDNVAGGRLAGEYMVELLGEDALVAELEGIPGASSTGERGGGFHEAVDGILEVVASQTANYNRAEGLDVTENILQAHPDIKGIFAHNDEMALGAIEAAETELVIIGFDATDDALAAIEEGTLAATIAQKPELMGETAVEIALKIMQGEDVPAEVPVEVELIKKA